MTLYNAIRHAIGQPGGMGEGFFIRDLSMRGQVGILTTKVLVL